MTSSALPNSQKAAQSRESGLTIGIELEYLFVALKQGREKDPKPVKEVAVKAVHVALASKLEAPCNVCQKPVRFDLPLNGLGSYRTVYALWEVGTEGMSPELHDTEAMDCLGEDKAANYEWYGVEVKSRILRLHDALKVREPTSDHTHLITWEKEVAAVVERLRNRFCMFGSKERKAAYLYTGKECGMHVHVGNENKGFDLDWLKKITCLYLGCEQQIDTIHPTNRINGVEWATRPVVEYVPFFNAQQTIDSKVHNRPLSQALMSSQYLRRQREVEAEKNAQKADAGSLYPGSLFDNDRVREASQCNDRDAWFTLIANAPDIAALHNLYHPHSRNVDVNFRNLDPSHNHALPIKNTVEFRQHTSTFEIDRILSWVDFVSRVVQFVRTQDLTKIIGLFSQQGRLGSPGTDILTLCETIGCSSMTQQHYRNQLTGEYARNVRGREKKQAMNALKGGDPLAKLCDHSIMKERRDLNPGNTRGRQQEKLAFGAYGQFPRSYIDAIAPSSMTETERAKITLGYKAPPGPLGKPFAEFSVWDSLPEKSDEEYSSGSGWTSPYASDLEEPRVRKSSERRKLSPSVERALSSSLASLSEKLPPAARQQPECSALPPVRLPEHPRESSRSTSSSPAPARGGTSANPARQNRQGES